jgi:hypothetical protein
MGFLKSDRKTYFTRSGGIKFETKSTNIVITVCVCSFNYPVKVTSSLRHYHRSCMTCLAVLYIL